MLSGGGKRGTFMKVEAGALACDADEVPVNAQDVPACADKRGLDLCQAPDCRMALDGVDPRRVPARGDPLNIAADYTPVFKL